MSPATTSVLDAVAAALAAASEDRCMHASGDPRAVREVRAGTVAGCTKCQAMIAAHALHSWDANSQTSADRAMLADALHTQFTMADALTGPEADLFWQGVLAAEAFIRSYGGDTHGDN